MIKTWTMISVLLGLALVAGCSTTRPKSKICPSPVLSRDLQETTALAESTEHFREAIMAQARVDRRGPIEINAISLSAGGQWGAFGAGLLAGWSENEVTPRPEFDLVTGVSAGAILSMPAFAGSDFDPALAFYRGTSADDVYDVNFLYGLAGEPSVASSAPMENLLRELMTPEMIARVKERHDNGNRLFVAATNLDTTALEFFDMGALAGDQYTPNNDNKGCLVEAILASAAVPGLLPPRHINGALYADGGMRDQVFFQEIEKARKIVERDVGRTIKVNAYVVVNGPLEPPPDRVEDSALEYFFRSVNILSDEILRDSLLEAINFAERRPQWNLRGIIPSVDIKQCDFKEAPALTFDPCLTRVLYDSGQAIGKSGEIPWLNADKLRQRALEF